MKLPDGILFAHRPEDFLTADEATGLAESVLRNGSSITITFTMEICDDPYVSAMEMAGLRADAVVAARNRAYDARRDSLTLRLRGSFDDEGESS